MFRNALRQSTRAAGALSASSRVASVSRSTRPSAAHRRALAAIAACTTSRAPSRVVDDGQWPVGDDLTFIRELSTLAETDNFPRREPHPPSSTAHRDKCGTMPMPNPHPPRSPPSSSRGSAVCRKRPASLRPVGFSPSGMISWGCRCDSIQRHDSSCIGKTVLTVGQ
jgi:hypothetical protein